jgi:hypothetical protein
MSGSKVRTSEGAQYSMVPNNVTFVGRPELQLVGSAQFTFAAWSKIRAVRVGQPSRPRWFPAYQLAAAESFVLAIAGSGRGSSAPLGAALQNLASARPE